MVEVQWKHREVEILVQWRYRVADTQTEWWYSRCVHIEYWIHGGNSWMECIQRGSAAGDWRLREIDLSLGGGVPTLCPPGAGITILGISFILFFSLAENQLKV